jgi:hypothetical protein
MELKVWLISFAIADMMAKQREESNIKKTPLLE